MSTHDAPRQRRLLLAAFAMGLAVSLVMVFRSQVSGDQLNFLARGWLLVTRGEFTHYGLTTSADGKGPGSLTTLLAAAPLVVWRDHRAVALLVWLSHLAAYALLDAVVRRTVSTRGRLLFALFYWLNPWRVGHSAFIWNPNLMFLCGAIHLWTAFHLRRRASFWWTVLHVLAGVAAVQLHVGGMILPIASCLLLWRRYLRVSWPGVAAGSGIAVLSLLPWAAAVAANPALLPGGSGFPFRNLLLVQPFVRGVVHWWRYSSLAIPGRLAAFDFSAILGADPLLGPGLRIAMLVVGAASLAVPLAVTVRLVRRRRRLLSRLLEGAGDRAWLAGAAAWLGVAALGSFAIAPTTPMAWQAFSALHGAALSVMLAVEAALRLGRPAVVRPLLRVWTAATVVLILAIAFGSPNYRRGGHHAYGLAVHADHPMLHDLGILETTGVTVDADFWFTPDVFLPDPAKGR
jgi:hypothetical protein